MNPLKLNHSYNALFFKYTNENATASARTVVPIVKDLFNVHSAIDFGCGHGGWLAIWKDLGVTDLLGIDGDYVDTNKLLVDRDHFITHDLSKPMDSKRKFDLVQSLEVGEHLPNSAALTFVKTLTDHGDLILFSAAPPGQGGVQHINEQPYAYWQSLFHRFDFEMLDVIRPKISQVQSVAPWYRFNTFVYVHRTKFEAMPPNLKKYRIAPEKKVPDIAPITYKIRKAIFRPLSVKMVDWLSMARRRWRCGPTG